MNLKTYKAWTKYKRPKMKRDTRRKCCLFYSRQLRKRQHFWRASLFIFGSSYFIRPLPNNNFRFCGHAGQKIHGSWRCSQWIVCRPKRGRCRTLFEKGRYVQDFVYFSFLWLQLLAIHFIKGGNNCLKLLGTPIWTFWKKTHIFFFWILMK